MRLAQTVAPAAPPVSLDDAKLHLRITHSSEDTLITALIDVARSHLEGDAGRQGILGRCMVSRTYRLTLDEFPAGRQFDLPQPPLVSVTSIVYRDADDAEQTLSSSLYDVVTDDLTGYVTLHRDQSWPATYDRDDAVQVTFVAGYGAATAVPAALRQAMLLHIGSLYANREAESQAAPALPPAYAALIANYRLGGWI